MRFGEKLSFLRKQRGMTQIELAEKLNISRQAVSRWERGESEPSTENLVGIAKLFDVTVDTLINEDAPFQDGSTVQPTAAEEVTDRNKSRYRTAKFVGIVILAIIAALTVLICMGKGQEKSPEQNSVNIEDLEKEKIDTDDRYTDDFLSDLID